MKTQEQIRADIDGLLAADKVEEAEAMVNQLTPIPLQEFLRRLNEAPVDDEPTTPEQRAALDRAWDAVRISASTLKSSQSG